MREAVLFDLDDTLYRERRFMLSGFAAVARHVEARSRLTARDAFRIMLAAARRGERSSAFQQVSEAAGLPDPSAGDLVSCYREHMPRLRLPAATRAVLDDLSGYALAIVTNGIPAVQAAKIRALGLHAWVPTIVYAHACGNRSGKPDPLVFREALSRVRVPASHAVFVGDHPWCDIAGARAAGMATVHLVPRGKAATDADAVVRTIREVPPAVRRLLQARAA